MAKKEKYNDLTKEQISAKLIEAEKEYQRNRFGKVNGELTQTHLLKESRRNIARMKTRLRELKLAQAE